MRAFLLYGKSSVALLVVGERSEHYGKARSSTQQWPAIVLLARLASETGQRAFRGRLASETGQRAFRGSQVTKTLMATSLYLRNS